MDLIDELEGFTSPAFNGDHFNEFAVRTPARPEKLNRLLLKHGIIGGLPLSAHVPRLDHHMLVATTEMHSDEDQDALVRALREVA